MQILLALATVAGMLTLIFFVLKAALSLIFEATGNALEIVFQALMWLGVAGAVGYMVKMHWRAALTGFWRFKIQRDTFIGEPEIALQHWRKQIGPTCAINAQRMILAMFGIRKNESQLKDRHAAYGLYHYGRGSTDLKNLMEGYGLKVRSVQFDPKYGMAEQLYYTLHSGRLAVASVNATLLNNPDPEFISSRRAVENHAIILTGLHHLHGDQYRVYYADSGVQRGAMKSVDIRVMQEAMGSRYIETPPVFKAKVKTLSSSEAPAYRIKGKGKGSEEFSIVCPECHGPLKFRLQRKVNVTCPRCHHQFSMEKYH